MPLGRRNFGSSIVAHAQTDVSAELLCHVRASNVHRAERQSLSARGGAEHEERVDDLLVCCLRHARYFRRVFPRQSFLSSLCIDPLMLPLSRSALSNLGILAHLGLYQMSQVAEGMNGCHGRKERSFAERSKSTQPAEVVQLSRPSAPEALRSAIARLSSSLESRIHLPSQDQRETD